MLKQCIGTQNYSNISINIILHDICENQYCSIYSLPRMKQRVIFSHCAYGVYSLHLSATTAPPMSKDPDYRIRECIVLVIGYETKEWHEYM